MAGNALFDIARKKFALGQLSWTQSPSGYTWWAALIDVSPTNGDAAINMETALTNAITLAGVIGSFEPVNPPGGQVRAVAALEEIGIDDNGACKAKSVTFTNVAASSGNSATGILIYTKNSGTPPSLTSSFPVAWIESATGLPITPNGGNIIVSWDTGVNKIFRL